MSPTFSTLVELLSHRASHQPNKEGYEFIASDGSEIQLSYAELDTRVRAVASLLQDANLQGERALLLYMPGIDYIVSFFACLYANVVAVPAYPPDPTRIERTLPRLMNVVNDCQAKAILTTSPIAALAQEMFSSHETASKIRWISTDTVSDDMATMWKKPPVTADSLAFLQYTSGSTSNPRGVMLTHHNLLSNLKLAYQTLDHCDNPRAISWLPPYHDMGLIGSILQPIYAGFPATIFSPMDFLAQPIKWLQIITDKKGTSSAGPNFAYDLCTRRISSEQLKSLDLSSWEIAINGAEPVRPETLENFAKHFAPCGFRKEAFHPAYGLAEATLFVGCTLDGPAIMHCDKDALNMRQVKEVPANASNSRALVSCGVSHFDVMIVDPETRVPCGKDEIGEIWIMHDSVSRGYWNKEDTNESIFQARTIDGKGPYLRTGDLGFLHQDSLFITGRKKDLIIVRGRNHYPQDIEHTVEDCHPNIRPGCIAAFSLPNDQNEVFALVVEVKQHDNQQELDATIEAIQKSVLAKHDLSCEIIALIAAKAIPKTSSGKIQRHLCKAMVLDGSLDTVHLWQKASPWLPRITDELASVLGLSAVDIEPHKPLLNYGLDSLMRQELIGRIEQLSGKSLSGLVINEQTNLITITTFLATHQSIVPAAAPVSPKADDNKASPKKEIAEEYYRFELFPGYLQLEGQLQTIQQLGLKNPFFTAHDGLAQDTISVKGRQLINFSSYNYLGLAGHPMVSQAAKDAIDRYGTTVSASRLVSGERPLHQELEHAIADLIGVDNAIVYVSGHATNVGTIGHLLSQGDLIVYDSLSHNSILQGIELSGAKGIPFPHSDAAALDRILTEHRHAYNRVLIAVEGVYSMDGDICPLPQYVHIKKRHKAFLMVDEAHSIGVMGTHGRGVSEYFGVNPKDVDLWMGTLSKSLAGCGGYIAGSEALIKYLHYSSPGFVYSVGISPPNTAASLAAIQLLAKEPQRVEQLHRNSRLFLTLCQTAGFDTGFSQGTPIVPLILGDSMKTLQLAETLFERGINVRPIIYPAVEEKLSRLRFFITASHTEDQIRHTVETIAEIMQ